MLYNCPCEHLCVECFQHEEELLFISAFVLQSLQDPRVFDYTHLDFMGMLPMHEETSILLTILEHVAAEIRNEPH